MQLGHRKDWTQALTVPAWWGTQEEEQGWRITLSLVNNGLSFHALGIQAGCPRARLRLWKSLEWVRWHLRPW